MKVEITALPSYEFQEVEFKEAVAFPLRKHCHPQNVAWSSRVCCCVVSRIDVSNDCSFAYAYQIIEFYNSNHWLLHEATKQQHVPVAQLRQQFVHSTCPGGLVGFVCKYTSHLVIMMVATFRCESDCRGKAQMLTSNKMVAIKEMFKLVQYQVWETLLFGNLLSESAIQQSGWNANKFRKDLLQYVVRNDGKVQFRNRQLNPTLREFAKKFIEDEAREEADAGRNVLNPSLQKTPIEAVLDPLALDTWEEDARMKNRSYAAAVAGVAATGLVAVVARAAKATWRRVDGHEAVTGRLASFSHSRELRPNIFRIQRAASSESEKKSSFSSRRSWLDASIFLPLASTKDSSLPFLSHTCQSPLLKKKLKQSSNRVRITVHCEEVATILPPQHPLLFNLYKVLSICYLHWRRKSGNNNPPQISNESQKKRDLFQIQIDDTPLRLLHQKRQQLLRA
uniref:Uncharacterized protein n=1 Tax=Salix viminalis TaxID=40686 RepID=A0A6N2N2D5_SALVM